MSLPPSLPPPHERIMTRDKDKDKDKDKNKEKGQCRLTVIKCCTKGPNLPCDASKRKKKKDQLYASRKTIQVLKGAWHIYRVRIRVRVTGLGLDMAFPARFVPKEATQCFHIYVI